MPLNRPPQPNRAPPGPNPVRSPNPEGGRPVVFIPAEAPWTAVVRDEVMGNEKQLESVKLEEVLRKREFDQALNAKEFAILAGVSYSIARQWFRLPGFPAFRGFVFWSDFTEWRRKQLGSGVPEVPTMAPAPANPVNTGSLPGLPDRAARILREAS
jgi:hypothetical protein